VGIVGGGIACSRSIYRECVIGAVLPGASVEFCRWLLWARINVLLPPKFRVCFGNRAAAPDLEMKIALRFAAPIIVTSHAVAACCSRLASMALHW